MILFFGPAGSGKSVQGQILAARHGWRWISAGQILRDTNDIEILKTISEGNLIDQSKMSEIIAQTLKKSKDIEHVILDGFPRQVEQAKWLVENTPEHERAVELAVVLDVPIDELQQRLKIRGRADDEAHAIEKRLDIYEKEITPIVDYLNEKSIPVRTIDGSGSVGQVHDKIEAELESILNK
ncbi:MAG: nucleoside monophosphate kinase [Candidatus Saccharibacteria bacterium]|nr:nucleoside monophosphate kinase [Candidatus Saccharibacteria bacterium]